MSKNNNAKGAIGSYFKSSVDYDSNQSINIQKISDRIGGLNLYCLAYKIEKAFNCVKTRRDNLILTKVITDFDLDCNKGLRFQAKRNPPKYNQSIHLEIQILNYSSY